MSFIKLLKHRVCVALWALVLLCTLASASFAATCGPATSPGNAPPAWQTYCWIDMSSFVEATVFGGGQLFSITLSDGSVLSFTLSGSSPGTNRVRAVAAPAWSGAATGNSAFIGIPGQPILYTTAGGTVDLTLSNIQVTPPAGVVSTGQFKLVVADAESTNGAESLTFVTNGGAWTLDDQVPPTTGSNYPTSSGIGTSTFVTTGVSGSVGAYIMGSLSPTTINVQLVAGGLQGVMIAVQYSSVVARKVISGTRANPADQFVYGAKATSNNVVLSSAVTAATLPYPSAVATLSSGVATTVFEEMAPGSISNLAQYTTSLTCTNAASGSSTSLPTAQPLTSYNIASTNYGDAISCTFTNTAKPATVAVQKVSVGAIGAFSFTSTNLASAPASITTSAVNTATPATPTPINVTTLNTAVTITENPGTKFTATSVSCSDANSALTGNPATFGTLAGNVVTIPAANVVAAAQITCVLTNTVTTGTAATIAVKKITLGAAGGPFSFTTVNLSLTPAPISTSSPGVAYPLVSAPVAATTNGSLVRITETLATNFSIVSASCVDGNAAASGNPTTTFGTLVGNQLTIAATNVRALAQITCTFTNIVNPAIPTIAIQKITSILPGGPFSFTTTNVAGTVANISTVTAGVAEPAVPNAFSVTSITTPVTLTEAANPNFNISAGSCVDTNAATSGNPASFGSLSGSVITVPVVNLRTFAKIVCTFTNTPRLPTVAVQKITSGGAIGGPFSFTATNLNAAIGNISTVASNTATPATPTAIQATAANTQVVITEALSSTFNTASATCTDANAAFTGNPASFGSLSGNVLTIPAANVKYASQINCVITNAPIPATVALRKTTTNAAGGPFTFSAANLASSPSSISTTASATPAPATPTAITVSALNTPVQISENANSYFTFSGATCTDANAAVTGNTGTFGTVTGLLLTVPAANVVPAAQIVCTFTNVGVAPRIRLQKALAGAGRLAAADQFSLSATGPGAPAALVTTGTAAAITSPALNFTATANSSYSLNEAMAAGSSSLITAYAKSAACTNNNPTGTNVTSLTSVPITFTIQAADDVFCTITNNPSATPSLVINKSFNTASTPVVVGQLVTYTYTITNIGNVNINNVQISDLHGTPPAPIPVGGSGITGETLTVPGPLGAAASPDAVPNNGVWSTLGPGATITLIYNHTVTQAEIDNG